ncbi:hypothetical protein ALP48_05438 [Pseudomonas syringae pv. solidagae]|uniref:Uncharacterized protein n=1 Tax=Pseudomonas syringae pv. solidagae TaxID=264458 RepID=A0A3M5L3Z1_PSESX|nr:hypothetical protein ALP48_05438 [Pseudomonas syringae pv. solidagae]
MPAALIAQVGGAADQQHEHACHQVRHGADPADHECIAETEVLDDRRQPEIDRVDAALNAEVDKAQDPYERHAQHGSHRAFAVHRTAQFIVGDIGLDPLTLSGRQPVGILDLVAQQNEGQHTQRHRRHALNQEHPLPAGHAALARSEMIENPSGKRAAQQAGDRDGRHEQCHDPPATLIRIPAREVQHDAGEETGLCHTGQKAQHVELDQRGDEQQAGRKDSPGNHHQTDPATRPKAVQRQIAGQATQHVANEEDTGAQAIDRLAETQGIEHLQLGKADVHAVEVIEQVTNEDKRDKAQGDATVDMIAFGVAHLVGRNRCHGGCSSVLVVFI